MPSGYRGGFDGIQVLVIAIGPVMTSQVVPEVLHGIQFWGIGWLPVNRDARGNSQGLGRVIRCPIPDHHDVLVRRDRRGDLIEEDLYDGRVESFTDEAFGLAGGRTDRGQHVQVAILGGPRGCRARARVGPDGGQRAFLPEAAFVFEPDFDGFVGVLGREVGDELGGFFLNAFCASGSALGCFGRGCSTEKPRACNRL